MKNLIALFDAICSTYDRTDIAPLPDGTTFCNVAVQGVLNLMGCHDLDGMSADQMCAYFPMSPSWENIKTMDQAQEMANEGSILVAGLDSIALNQSHGHVCVIRPGLMCDSGKWGMTARCLNIGGQNFLARGKKGPLTGMAVGLNEAFIPKPLMWVWVPSKIA